MLVVLQFSCSVALIISTIAIYRQLQHTPNSPLGCRVTIGGGVFVLAAALVTVITLLTVSFVGFTSCQAFPLPPACSPASICPRGSCADV